MARSQIKSDLRVRAYAVMERAVEDGVRAGFSRAHKHTDSPSPEALVDEIANQVMNAICEWFVFEEGDGEG